MLAPDQLQTGQQAHCKCVVKVIFITGTAQQSRQPASCLLRLSVTGKADTPGTGLVQLLQCPFYRSEIKVIAAMGPDVCHSISHLRQTPCRVKGKMRFIGKLFYQLHQHPCIPHQKLGVHLIHGILHGMPPPASAAACTVPAATVGRRLIKVKGHLDGNARPEK